MDPTSHVPIVSLYHWLIRAFPLTREERLHLDSCEHCQEILQELQQVVPHVVHAA
jgi:hypothetical protein